MPWINDVVPYTTILSTWGNNVRNHLVHQFNNRNDRDTNARPVDGMLCITVDTGCVWQYFGSLSRWVPFSTPWKSWSPVLISSSGGGGGNPNQSVPAAAAQYRYVSPRQVQVQCAAGNVDPIGASWVGVLYFSLPVGLSPNSAMPAGAVIGNAYLTNFRTGLGYGALVRQDGGLPRCYFGMIGMGANKDLVQAAYGTINLWESDKWAADFHATYQVDPGPSDFL